MILRKKSTKKLALPKLGKIMLSHYKHQGQRYEDRNETSKPKKNNVSNISNINFTKCGANGHILIPLNILFSQNTILYKPLFNKIGELIHLKIDSERIIENREFIQNNISRYNIQCEKNN